MTHPRIDADELRAELAAFGFRLRGARAVQVGTGGRKRPSANPSRLMGWAIRETSGTASATVLLHDGEDTTGDLVAPITLSPGESTRDWFGPVGVQLAYGLYVEVAAGAIDGAVFMGAV